MTEPEKVSSCCFGEMAMLHPMGPSCTVCGEPCDPVYPPCPEGVCDGSGLVSGMEYHGPEHGYEMVGTEDCICRKREPELDGLDRAELRETLESI